MQFKVPQDVQQADRILYFLTLTQLIICVLGFGVAYGIYAVLQKQELSFIFWFPPVLIIGIITVCFAFVKIANMPFHRFLAVMIVRFLTPSKRVWVKGADRVIVDENMLTEEDLKIKEQAEKMKNIEEEKQEKLSNLSSITGSLDSLEPLAVEAIDRIPDEKLLEKTFLKEEERKKDISTEEKIIKASVLPKPSVSIPEAAQKTPMPTGENPGQKKKRRRRRRGKKQALTPAATPTSVAAPIPAAPMPAVAKTPAVAPISVAPMPAVAQPPAAAPMPAAPIPTSEAKALTPKTSVPTPTPEPTAPSVPEPTVPSVPEPTLPPAIQERLAIEIPETQHHELVLPEDEPQAMPMLETMPIAKQAVPPREQTPGNSEAPAKKSEEFSSDQLKAGQTITFS